MCTLLGLPRCPLRGAIYNWASPPRPSPTGEQLSSVPLPNASSPSSLGVYGYALCLTHGIRRLNFTCMCRLHFVYIYEGDGKGLMKKVKLFGSVEHTHDLGQVLQRR